MALLFASFESQGQSQDNFSSIENHGTLLLIHVGRKEQILIYNHNLGGINLSLEWEGVEIKNYAQAKKNVLH